MHFNLKINYCMLYIILLNIMILCDTLTSQIKNTIFAAFGKNQLPTININASIIEIQS